MDMSTILVRYAEIALKGKNQPQFISRLAPLLPAASCRCLSSILRRHLNHKRRERTRRSTLGGRMPGVLKQIHWWNRPISDRKSTRKIFLA